MQYLDLVREIAKASGATTPKAWLAVRKNLQDYYEPKLLKVVQSSLKRARRKLLTHKDSIHAVLNGLHKSESDSAKDQIRIYLEQAFAGSALELSAVEGQLVDELAQEFGSVYQVKMNYDVINTQATKYLEDYGENYFSTLSDNQADGLLALVADEMKSVDGYSVDTIADSVLNEWLSNSMYFGTDQGSRKIGTEVWSLAVARTEVARAASYGQKTILKSIGMKTWQWCCNLGACDDCLENQDQIVEIDSPFPSGDSEPPLHPQCCPPGILITTRRGLVPVENIVLGDEVLTHTGRYCRVLQTFVHNVSEDLFQLRSDNHSVTVTGNHPVYHRERWTRADALQIGDEIVCMDAEAMLGASGQTNQVPLSLT